jgi:hypothetical protein
MVIVRNESLRTLSFRLDQDVTLAAIMLLSIYVGGQKSWLINLRVMLHTAI